MAALAADKKRIVRNINGMKEAEVLLADSQTVYEGAIIMRNSSGDPVVGADTASCVGMGVASEAVTSGSSNTTRFVKLQYGHEEWFATAGTFTKASIGANVTISDDQTVALAATTTNDVLFGMLVQLETINGTPGAWIRVAEFA
jgi:hypothetical protein